MKNKIKKMCMGILAMSILTVGSASTMSAGIVNEPLQEATNAAIKAVADLVDDDGPYETTVELLETRGKKNGNGKVFMIDNIYFEVDVDKDGNKKVDKSTVSIEQSADNLWYFEGGTKYVRTNSDGSVTYSSTYYCSDPVTGFVSVVTDKDIPVGLNYSKSVYYTLNVNGSVTRSSDKKGKFSFKIK